MEGFNCYDAVAFVSALVAEDMTETGWSRDPSGRDKALDLLGLPVPKPQASGDEDLMAAVPPAELAEDQLAEFRSLMGRSNPPNPPTD